jgi:two-component system phosphorelay protein LuxU
MELINKNKIAHLAQEIGEENVPILLDIFLSELSGYAQKLADQNLPNKIEYLKDISHALKSSAASFGADKLCAKAVDIDSKGKANYLFDEAEEVATMRDLIEETHRCYCHLMD